MEKEKQTIENNEAIELLQDMDSYEVSNNIEGVAEMDWAIKLLSDDQKASYINQIDDIRRSLDRLEQELEN